jgi:hypothetical protein
VALPEEARVVGDVFKQAAVGVRSLNRQRLRTKFTGRVGGGAWTPRAVLRILRNPVYLGKIGGVRAEHEPLVDVSLFDQANGAINARQTRAPSRRAASEERDPFLLRGMIRCARCGQLMTTASRPPRGKGTIAPRFYRCRGLKGCHGTQVAAPEFEKRVVKQLMDMSANATSADAVFLFGALQSIWQYMREWLLRSYVRGLIEEVRWDAEHDRIALTLEEDSVREHAASLRHVRAEADAKRPSR